MAQWNLTGNNNAIATSILGTTNAIPLNLTTNNVQRLVIDANGKIGIGTATPVNILTVKGTGSTPAASWVAAGAPLFVGFGETAVGNADYILAMASTSNNGRPVFVGRRSRGTLAVPTAMANNDFIMSMLASAHDGAAFQNPATIDFLVDGTVSAGNVPARISFVTGSNSTNRAERLKIGNTGDITMNTNQLFLQKATGNIGIGTISPAAKLDVNGDALIGGLTIGKGSGGFFTNTAIGIQTLFSNATGNSNTATGSWALYFNKSGNFNTANGDLSLYNNFSGESNVAVGSKSLYTNTTGSYNVATGAEAMYENTVGYFNTANGFSAMNKNTEGDRNTAMGSFALGSNTTGTRNAAFGVDALYANTTGTGNVANGFEAMHNNTTANNNIALGRGALYSNTVRSYTIAIGDSALYNSGTIVIPDDATYNTAVGSKALYANTTGNWNVALGYNVLKNNTTGVSLTASGTYALVNNTTGIQNTAQGTYSLGTNTTGFWLTGMGAFTDVSTNNLNNATALGAGAIVNASKKVRIGDALVTVVESAVGSWTTSDGRFKTNVQEEVKGLEFINLLRPVVYNFDTKKYQQHLMQNYSDSLRTARMKGREQDFVQTTAIRQSGLKIHIKDPAQCVDSAGHGYGRDFCQQVRLRDSLPQNCSRGRGSARPGATKYSTTAVSVSVAPVAVRTRATVWCCCMRSRSCA